MVRALVGTGPAILASAGTVAAGLSLMYFAKFRVFHTAGPAVAISIVLACLASLTLAPALAYLTGSRTFWPRKILRFRIADFGLEEATADLRKAQIRDLKSEIRNAGSPKSERGRPRLKLWDSLAAFTVRFRVPVLLLGLIVLIPLAMLGWRQQKVYDTLADLPADAASVRGADIFQRHFLIGEMAPVQMMVGWMTRSAGRLALRCRGRGPGPLADPRVQVVRSVSHPLGIRRDVAPEITFSRKNFDGTNRLIPKLFATSGRPIQPAGGPAALRRADADQRPVGGGPALDAIQQPGDGLAR